MSARFPWSWPGSIAGCLLALVIALMLACAGSPAAPPTAPTHGADTTVVAAADDGEQSAPRVSTAIPDGPISEHLDGSVDGVELVGTFSFASDAQDLSGLTDILEDGTPHDQLGAFGSAIAYTGEGERYVAMVDRGPSNGDVTYKCRFHTFEIHVAPGENPPVHVKLLATTLLVNEKGLNFVGRSTAFDATNSSAGLRLDPEGVRVGRKGTLFLSDEYGPFVYEVDTHGQRLRALRVPPEFSVAQPGAGKEEKIAGNVRGRVSNKGFEGLAITPDGSKLYALLQAPLIQDHGRDGLFCRMLEIDLAHEKTRQFAVPLEEAGRGFNELLAVDDQRFLVIERDGDGGTKARSKKIVELDLAGASDVSARPALPADALPAGMHAVAKRRFLDLLDPRFHLSGQGFPEKIEGLAFGPDLPDGRHVMIVTTDNDFLAGKPSWIWVFAIDPKALPGLRPQVFDARR